MASNLNSARSLIQADLDHARNVLGLWTQQVSALEQTLEQINAVRDSRDALRVQYQGGGGRTSALAASVSLNEKPKRGRKPTVVDGNRAVNAAASGNDAAAKRHQTPGQRKGATPGPRSEARKNKANLIGSGKADRVKPAAKYKDPNSDKTWSGRGRRPAWFAGDAEQYEIRVLGRKKPVETKTASGDGGAAAS